MRALTHNNSIKNGSETPSTPLKTVDPTASSSHPPGPIKSILFIPATFFDGIRVNVTALNTPAIILSKISGPIRQMALAFRSLYGYKQDFLLSNPEMAARESQMTNSTAAVGHGTVLEHKAQFKAILANGTLARRCILLGGRWYF